MKKHHIYWWNLENLFDVENSPRRSEFLQDTLKGELEGWDIGVLQRKLENLVGIIAKFNGGKGPDILGVCEIENAFVIEMLIHRISLALNREYGFVISDSNDKRGIDTALIYDTTLYKPDPETFSLRIIKRNSTRDLFQVLLKTTEGNSITCILNHWPSRTGGKLESEPYRIMVAENLAYWIERIHEELGNNASILLMGDFNDDPYNRSITDYLLATNNQMLVKSNRTRKRYLYNPMYRFLDSQLGTYVFGNVLNILDQFMVSKAILSENQSSPFKLGGVRIVDYPELITGTYNKPIKYGRPSTPSAYDPNGFSDHLPIELVLIEN